MTGVDERESPGRAPDPAGLDAALPVLAANGARFEALLATAEAHLRARRLDEAGRAAQQAAGVAWMEHTGIHASPRLEAVARAIAPAGSTWRPQAGATTRVVHVLTQAYATGGHTRWSERIIRMDRARSHSVVLTAQGGIPVPGFLEDAVAASGGRVMRLEPGPLLDRAARLRSLVWPHGLVVANLHPNDVTAIVALADARRRPPVALLDHADHAFWLGQAAADLVVDFRAAGAALGRRRRGLAAERSAILPLPLEAPSPAPDRDALRAALGIRPGDVLAISAGSAWKFDPGARRGLPSFAEVVAPVAAADPRLQLLVLGPRPGGQWTEASRMTAGRMRAVGTRTDYGDLVRAADLYLDPFPMGSLYSILEPGILGVPGISMRQWPDQAAVLMANAPGLDAVPHEADDEAGYHSLLEGLLASPEARSDLGGALAASIGALHAGQAWMDAWETVVVRTRDRHRGAPDGAWAGAPDLDRGATDLLARGLAWIVERVAPPPDVVVAHLPLARP